MQEEDIVCVWVKLWIKVIVVGSKLSGSVESCWSCTQIPILETQSDYW